MIVTLTGTNDLQRSSELQKITDEFSAKNSSDLAIEKVSGEEDEFERISDALQGMSLFTTKKLVILFEPSWHKKFSEEIETVIARLGQNTDVIIVEPKLDRRLNYYKFLKKNTDFREFNELEINDLKSWAINYVNKNNGNISSSDVQFLIERVGTNQMLLKNELDKLLSYDTNINRTNIELLTEITPSSTIFQLIDAALAGNKARVIELYSEQKALKTEPQQIIALIGWQLHVLAMIKTTDQGQNYDEIAKTIRQNPFVVRKSLSITKRLSFEQLKQMVARALEIDVRIKSENIDSDEAIQYYLLSIV